MFHSWSSPPLWLSSPSPAPSTFTLTRAPLTHQCTLTQWLLLTRPSTHTRYPVTRAGRFSVVESGRRFVSIAHSSSKCRRYKKIKPNGFSGKLFLLRLTTTRFVFDKNTRLLQLHNFQLRSRHT